jgi:hypothetical protein
MKNKAALALTMATALGMGNIAAPVTPKKKKEIKYNFTPEQLEQLDIVNKKVEMGELTIKDKKKFVKQLVKELKEIQ